MKKQSFLALAALAPLALALPDVTSPAQDEALKQAATEVVAFVEHYAEVIEADDMDAVRALFVPDDRFAWFTDGEKRYASAEEIVAGLEMFSGMVVSTEYTDLRVVALSPTIASVRTGFATEVTVPNAEDFAYAGVITWVLEKSAGDWRVVTGHTSTPSGPPDDWGSGGK